MARISLSNTLAKVVVDPTLGGSITQYTVFKNDTAYPIFREIDSPKVSGDTCNFPLVPFSNRIRDGKFEWQGKHVELPLNFLPETNTIHGHGWQLPWRVVEQSDNQLIIEYDYAAAEWPFSYKATQTITLNGSALTMTLALTNLGSSQMPAGLGMHPYFTRTEHVRLHANLEKMWAVDSECLPTHLADAPPSLKSKDGMLVNEHVLDNVLVDYDGEAHIAWPDWGLRATVSSSSNCQFLVCYSPKNEDFFCIEPVTNITDAFNLHRDEKLNTGLITIEPKQTVSMQMSINVEDCS